MIDAVIVSTARTPVRKACPGASSNLAGAPPGAAGLLEEA